MALRQAVDRLDGQPVSTHAAQRGLRYHNNEMVYDKDGNPVKGTWPPLVKNEYGGKSRQAQ